MKNELFDELLASVQEMDEIIQGKKAAARMTEYSEPEVKVIRWHKRSASTKYVNLSAQYCNS